MLKRKKDNNVRGEVRPLILVEDVDYYCSDAFAELLRLADEFDWELRDLKRCNYVLPTNPAPQGAIINTRFASTHEEDEGRIFDFPTVRLAYAWEAESNQYPRVLLDLYEAGWMAMDYFAEKGFKTIVILSRKKPEHMSPVYRAAWDWAESRSEMNLYVDFLGKAPGKEEGRKARLERWGKQIGRLIATLPKPLGFLGGTDTFAVQFCQVCQAYGFSIPEDIAVIGVDNSHRICETAPVKLSSVDLNQIRAVREAAYLLKRMLDGEPPPAEPIMIPPKGIVSRRSTDVLAAEDPRVSRAIRYMWDHLSWPITVDDISYEVGVSSRTLTRLFKANLGRGVIEELRRKRLEQAAELLITSDRVVDEISQAVGFPSPSHLYKSFQERYGVTPGVYRSQERAKREYCSFPDYSDLH